MNSRTFLFAFLFGVIGAVIIYFGVEYRILSFIIRGGTGNVVIIILGTAVPLFFAAWLHSKNYRGPINFGRALVQQLSTSFFILFGLAVLLFIRMEIHGNSLNRFINDISYGSMYIGPPAVVCSLIFAAIFNKGKNKRRTQDDLLDDLYLGDE